MFNLGTLLIKYKSDTTSITESEKKIKDSNARVAKSLSALGKVFIGVFTVEAAKSLLLTADNMSVLERRTQQLAKTVRDGSRAFNELLKISSQTGTKIDDVASVFNRFLVIQDEIGATTNELLTMTETLIQLGTIGGSSGQEISNTLIQLSQGLAAGVLRGEELNSVLEGMPLVAKAIAAQLGVSVGELKAMGAEGKIVSEEVLQAILAVADDTAKKFEEMPKSLSQSFATLKTEFSNLIKEIDQQAGGSQFIGMMLERMARGASNINQNFFASPEEIQNLDAAYNQMERIIALQEQASRSRALFSGLLTDDDISSNSQRYQSYLFYEKQVAEYTDIRLRLAIRMKELTGETVELVNKEEAARQRTNEETAKTANNQEEQLRFARAIVQLELDRLDALEKQERQQAKIKELLEGRTVMGGDISALPAWQQAAEYAKEGTEAWAKYNAQLDEVNRIHEKYGNKAVASFSQIPPWLQEINKLQEEGRETWKNLSDEQLSDLDKMIKKYQEMANAWNAALANMQTAVSNFGSYLENEREKELDAFKEAENKKLKSRIEAIENNRRMTDKQKREAIEAAEEQSQAAIDAKDEETRKRAAAEKALFITEQAIAVARILINTAVETSKVLANPVLAGVVAASGAALAISTAALGYQEYKSTFGTSDVNNQANISGATSGAIQSGNSGRSIDVVVNNNVGANVTATQTAGGALQLDIDTIDSALAQGIMSNTSRTSQAINNSYNTSRRLG